MSITCQDRTKHTTFNQNGNGDDDDDDDDDDDLSRV
jgi:hypothetical protein